MYCLILPLLRSFNLGNFRAGPSRKLKLDRALDPKGKEYSSEGLAALFQKTFNDGISTITLVIGGADGLQQTMREKYDLISLSKMTFTHQITRLILTEQLYRALEILRGSQYHK